LKKTLNCKSDSSRASLRDPPVAPSGDNETRYSSYARETAVCDRSTIYYQSRLWPSQRKQMFIGLRRKLTLFWLSPPKSTAKHVATLGKARGDILKEFTRPDSYQKLALHKSCTHLLTSICFIFVTGICSAMQCVVVKASRTF